METLCVRKVNPHATYFSVFCSTSFAYVIVEDRTIVFGVVVWDESPHDFGQVQLAYPASF